MAYVPGVALLAALAVGCSAGSDGSATDADSKPGGPTVTTAPPGKYRTLPAPCRAVPSATLKDLLPGVAELPRQQQEKALRGSPTITYDTDRKVGCSWKADAPDSTRNLSIDFERVVSYDPLVSDDDRARALYVKKENAAELPGSTTSGTAPEKGTPTSAGAGRRGRRRRPGRPGTARARRIPRPPPPPAPHPAPLERRAARTCGPAWSAGSEMRRFWTICSPGQVPPHSTAP